MKKQTLTLILLILGAFLLFYPQSSKAAKIFCKCTLSIGTGSTDYGCQYSQNETFHYSTTQACEKFKGAFINDRGEWYDAGVLGDGTHNLVPYSTNLTCEAFADNQCIAPVVEETKPTSIDNLYNDLSARKPVLEINIPGLNFSDIGSTTDETGATYFYIAWLPELISALYKFLLAVVSIVAVVVIIIQGLRVVASGGGEGKTTAYKKIFQAVMGLFIAWGSYAILFTINPALVQFNALKVKVVEGIPLSEPEIEMMTTEGDTTVPEDGEADEPAVGSYTPKFSNCPIALENPASTDPLSPRTKEFFEKIVSSEIINGNTEAERILQVGDAAVLCGIAMGNCGRTAGDIYTLAGIRTKSYPDTSCLLQKAVKKTKTTKAKSAGCGTHFNKEVHHIPSMYIDLPGKEPALVSQNLPVATVAKTLFADPTLKKAGWPDSWAKELQPGDAIWVYNGNSSGGNHSAIFTGWKNGSYEKSKGNAQVIQGRSGYVTKRGYPICITTACGDKMKPLVKTMKVQH